MAKVKNFSREMIDKLSGVIDFYYWRGIPVARRWPRKTTIPPSAAMLASRAAFADSRRDLKFVSGKVRAAWAVSAVCARQAWLDYYTSIYMRTYKLYKRAVAVLHDFYFDTSPARVCLTLKGQRLDGQRICLFEKFPKPLSKNFRKRGVYDMCKKMRYSKPVHCYPLISGGEILKILYYNSSYMDFCAYYDSRAGYNFHTVEEAYLDAVSNPPYYGDAGSGWGIPVTSGHYAYYSPAGFCQCHLSSISKNVITTDPFVDPGWLHDDHVHFFLSFNIPEGPVECDWLRLSFLGQSIPLSGGVFSGEVSKSLVIAAGYTITFSLTPFPQGFLNFMSLPFYDVFFNHYLEFFLISSGNITLTVRGGAVDYRVCWPVDQARRAKIAAIIDSESGLVVGPPIELN